MESHIDARQHPTFKAQFQTMYSFIHLYCLSLLLKDRHVTPAQKKHCTEGWAKQEFCQSPHIEWLLGFRVASYRGFDRSVLHHVTNRVLLLENSIWERKHKCLMHCIFIDSNTPAHSQAQCWSQAHTAAPGQQSCAARGHKDALGMADDVVPAHTTQNGTAVHSLASWALGWGLI